MPIKNTRIPRIKRIPEIAIGIIIVINGESGLENESEFFVSSENIKTTLTVLEP
jgi:hypothetical protein